MFHRAGGERTPMKPAQFFIRNNLLSQNFDCDWPSQGSVISFVN
jgi:hypothetical protein